MTFLRIKDMDIGDALKLIRRSLRKKVVESRHFKRQCENRELDMNIIRETVRKNKILGIITVFPCESERRKR